jgi:hypothetical protein
MFILLICYVDTVMLSVLILLICYVDTVMLSVLILYCYCRQHRLVDRATTFTTVCHATFLGKGQTVNVSPLEYSYIKLLEVFSKTLERCKCAVRGKIQCNTVSNSTEYIMRSLLREAHAHSPSLLESCTEVSNCFLMISSREVEKYRHTNFITYFIY